MAVFFVTPHMPPLGHRPLPLERVILWPWACHTPLGLLPDLPPPDTWLQRPRGATSIQLDDSRVSTDAHLFWKRFVPTSL